MIGRHSFIAGSAAGLALGATGRARAQSSGTPLRVAVFPIDVGVGGYYARDMGFFKKHGIDADLQIVTNGPAVASALIGGSLDVAIADTTTLAVGHEKGLPFVLLAPSGAYRSSEPTSALLVAKASPIAAPRDLVGKTCGVASLRGFGEVVLRMWARKNGLKPDDYKVVEIGFAEMDAALQSGRVDFVQAEEPIVSMIAERTRIIARPADAVGKQFVEGGFFGTADFVKRNPDLTKRFADAIAETNAWANGHRAETFEILSKYSKAPLPKTMARAYYPERLRAAEIQPVIDATVAAGFLQKPFPARDIIAPGVS